MKIKYLFFFLVLIVACGKPSPPEYDMPAINGTWMRIDGDKPEYDSMLLVVESGVGRIQLIPSGYYNYFNIGDEKWKDITPHAHENKQDTVDFLFYELASDGTYYKAYANMINDSTLYITKNMGLDGNLQTWRKN